MTIVYNMYKFYGDLDIVRENFDSLYRYSQFLVSLAESTGIANYYNEFGDW